MQGGVGKGRVQKNSRKKRLKGTEKKKGLLERRGPQKARVRRLPRLRPLLEQRPRAARFVGNIEKKGAANLAKGKVKGKKRPDDRSLKGKVHRIVGRRPRGEIQRKSGEKSKTKRKVINALKRSLFCIRVGAWELRGKKVRSKSGEPMGEEEVGNLLKKMKQYIESHRASGNLLGV